MNPTKKSRMFTSVIGAAIVACTIPAQAQEHDGRTLSSIGAPEMAGLMDALFAAFVRSNPDMRKSAIWDHRTDRLALGALMYERADMAPMIRQFDRNELAPYDHQFRGDMMKAPVMVSVALREGRPVWLAVNQRPGAPLAEDVRRFLAFALSTQGQAVIAGVAPFAALPMEVAIAESARLNNFVAQLDPGIDEYHAIGKFSGEISSVGSDGMKSLMDRWMNEFTAIYPAVRRGERWEHLGTLNGFHALMAGLTDLAPMGRELWPDEAHAYAEATGVPAPLEIKVARGGFNTPQRTTAQVIFVHKDNPLRSISLARLKEVLSENPKITRWGQLGASGEWADRPIHLYMPPPASPNAMFMQVAVLHGAGWNPAARSASITETANSLADDPQGLGFGGMEEGAPGLRALAVSKGIGDPAIAPDYPSAAAGVYPLTRFMFIRLNRKTGEALPAHTREFLRYILSRQGQRALIASGYFPLTEQELRAERTKLD